MISKHLILRILGLQTRCYIHIISKHLILRILGLQTRCYIHIISKHLTLRVVGLQTRCCTHIISKHLILRIPGLLTQCYTHIISKHLILRILGLQTLYFLQESAIGDRGPPTFKISILIVQSPCKVVRKIVQYCIRVANTGGCGTVEQCLFIIKIPQ